MPRGDKSSYTSKQKRQARHIAETYEERGVPDAEAEGRAWATVNKATGGGKLSGSGRGKSELSVTKASRSRSDASVASEQASAAARKGWVTRRKNAGG